MRLIVDVGASTMDNVDCMRCVRVLAELATSSLNLKWSCITVRTSANVNRTDAYTYTHSRGLWGNVDAQVRDKVAVCENAVALH